MMLEGIMVFTSAKAKVEHDILAQAMINCLLQKGSPDIFWVSNLPDTDTPQPA
jgi:hypothetical protein